MGLEHHSAFKEFEILIASIIFRCISSFVFLISDQFYGKAFENWDRDDSKEDRQAVNGSGEVLTVLVLFSYLIEVLSLVQYLYALSFREKLD